MVLKVLLAQPARKRATSIPANVGVKAHINLGRMASACIASQCHCCGYVLEDTEQRAGGHENRPPSIDLASSR